MGSCGHLREGRCSFHISGRRVSPASTRERTFLNAARERDRALNTQRKGGGFINLQTERKRVITTQRETVLLKTIRNSGSSAFGLRGVCVFGPPALSGGANCLFQASEFVPHAARPPASASTNQGPLKRRFGPALRVLSARDFKTFEPKMAQSKSKKWC